MFGNKNNSVFERQTLSRKIKNEDNNEILVSIRFSVRSIFFCKVMLCQKLFILRQMVAQL